MRSAQSEISTSKAIILWVLALVLLRPHPAVLPPGAATYLGDLLLVGGVVFFLTAPIRFQKLARFEVICWLVISVITTISVSKGVWVLDSAIEGLKFLYYLSFCFLLRIITPPLRRSAEAVFNMACFAYVIVVVIAVIQFVMPPVMYELIVYLWGDEKLRGFPIAGIYARVYSSFYNANWFGFIAGGFLLLFLSKMLSNDGHRKAGLLILFFSSVILILFSGSRSAALATFFGVVVMLLMNYRKLFKARGFTMFLTGIVLSILLVQLLIKYFEFGRFFVLAQVLSGHVSEDSSARARVEYWQLGLPVVKDSAIVGAGIPEGVLFHNSFITLAAIFGIPMAFALLVCLAVAIYLMIRGSKYKARCVPLLAQAFVMFNTGEFMFSTQVMLTLLILIWLITAMPRATMPRLRVVKTKYVPQGDEERVATSWASLRSSG